MNTQQFQADQKREERYLNQAQRFHTLVTGINIATGHGWVSVVGPDFVGLDSLTVEDANGGTIATAERDDVLDPEALRGWLETVCKYAGQVRDVITPETGEGARVQDAEPVEDPGA